MSGSTTLYTFSIEGMEGIVNIVAYTVTDAENTLKEWLNPGVEIKLLHKDKVTLGKEYRKLNTQDIPVYERSDNTTIEDIIRLTEELSKVDNRIKELEKKRSNSIMDIRLK